MSQAPTREIETPIGKHKVLVKQWLNGREREYVDGPIYSSMSVTPRAQGNRVEADMGKLDLEKMIAESEHRAISTFIVSIDGDNTNILDRVLDMHEEDTAFVKKELAAKKNPTNDASKT